jgi:hypothetical protein
MTISGETACAGIAIDTKPNTSAIARNMLKTACLVFIGFLSWNENGLGPILQALLDVMNGSMRV